MYQLYHSVEELVSGGDRSCQPDIKWLDVAVRATAPPIMTRVYYNQGLQVCNHHLVNSLKGVWCSCDSVARLAAESCTSGCGLWDSHIGCLTLVIWCNCDYIFGVVQMDTQDYLYK